MRVPASLERSVAFNRRRYVRHPVQIGAGLSANIRPSTPVAVTDLSCGGCGIETESVLNPTDKVWLKLPGFEAWPCKVVWAEDGRAGLSFDHPLHPAVVAHITGSAG
jgi:hypothetical protein